MPARKRRPKPTSEKKGGLAANRRRRRVTRVTKVTRETREVRANPPLMADFTHVLLPGFGAYAGTRFLQRVVFSLASKRWPKLGKHLHALAGVAAFGATWLFAHKVRSIAKYHDGIVMGSGIAAFQGVAQTYLPKYGWLTADVQPNGAGGPQVQQQPQQLTAPTGAGGDEYSYLEDQLDAIDGRRARPARTTRAPRRTAAPMASAMQMAAAISGDDPSEQIDADLLDELDDGESLDDLYAGSLAPN